jgi:uncharacterized membrane protein
MLSRREVEGFANNVASFALANFIATFFISIAFFHRTVEASIIVALIGPLILMPVAFIFVGVWYLYRLIKSKRKNG